LNMYLKQRGLLNKSKQVCISNARFYAHAMPGALYRRTHRVEVPGKHGE
jgi:hypothetical protein